MCSSDLGPDLPAGAAREVAQPGRGAVVSRLDITRNYSTGSESSARAFIRWLGARSISRMKRGQAGDESVWWANTRHMLKAYIKHLEMIKHGADSNDDLVSWLKDQGVVSVPMASVSDTVRPTARATGNMPRHQASVQVAR